MDKGGGARKALQQGGRFLSDLFKVQQQPHGHGLGQPPPPLQQQQQGDEQQEDALGSSQRAQSHSAALERFLGHVNAAMVASTAAAAHAEEAAARRRPSHEKTLSSSSASIVSCGTSASSEGGEVEEDGKQQGDDDGDDDDDDGAEEAEEAEQRAAELRPTFRAVPMGVLTQHADASLAVVDRIAAYVDDRWRLESKYARERARLKLQLVNGGGSGGAGGGGGYDAMDALAEALALFQEVEAAQINATVEEIDQQVRQPLLQLRAQLHGIVQDGRQEQRAVAREVHGLEARLAKSKAGLARLRERKNELRARIEEYQRRVAAAAATASRWGAASSSSSGGGGGWDPPDNHGAPDGVFMTAEEGFPSSSSASSSPPPHQPPQVSFPAAEAQLLPSLERRLGEVASEIGASEAEIQAQGRQLMDALGRQDRAAARWAREFERADKTRRFALQAAATAYVEAGARATQRSLFQLESLMQLAARVDLVADQLAFIERHRDGVGTAPRTPALRLLERQREWEDMKRQQEQQRRRRRSSSSSSSERAGEGGEEGEDVDDMDGQWEEVQSPAQHTYGLQQQDQSSPSPPPREEMVTLRRSPPVPTPTAATATANSSGSPGRARPSRGGGAEGQEDGEEGEAVAPSFDEREDGAVVSAFVRQLFAPVATSASTPASTTAPARSRSPSSSPPATRESFDWDRLAQALEASAPSSTAAAAAFSFHSTAGERRRFFERVLAGEDGRGRAAFLAELNLQRSKETNVGAGFEELAALLWAFLLHTQRHRDVHGAKMAMMLASTFWRPKPAGPGPGAGTTKGRREFVGRRLVWHPLWKDSVFWTRALQDQIREQLEAVGELLPFGAAAWHDAGAEARADVVGRVHNTVFSNVGALAHSMLEFGAPVEDAREFVLRASEQYGLPEEMEHLLLEHVARREQRQQQRRGQRQPTPTPPPPVQQEVEQQQHQQQQPALTPAPPDGDADAGAQQILEMAQAAATM